MEDLKKSVTELSGAVNAMINQIRSVEARLSNIEKSNGQNTQVLGTLNEGVASMSHQVEGMEGRIAALEVPSHAAAPTQPPVRPMPPSTEEEVMAITRLPDTVKELQVFEGDPTEYVSWIQNVQDILADYQIMEGKPLYRAILKSIRNKVRGGANAALVSYNVATYDWPGIKRCLSLHYADKRDVRTLDHQLGQLTQRGRTVDAFYAAVNHQFALIVNKLQTESYSTETIQALIETYRNKALDVFIRGLDGGLPTLLLIQKPSTLPEAYKACLNLQNMTVRSQSIHTSTAPNLIPVPVNHMPKVYTPTRPTPQVPNYVNYPHPTRSAFVPRAGQNLARGGSHQFRQNFPPPRPTAPKPQERMEVDSSGYSRQVNYMNRPPQRDNGFKRRATSENLPRKQQRLYHVHLPEVVEEEEQIFSAEPLPNETAGLAEQGEADMSSNFMAEASPAFLI